MTYATPEMLKHITNTSILLLSYYYYIFNNPNIKPVCFLQCLYNSLW